MKVLLATFIGYQLDTDYCPAADPEHTAGGSGILIDVFEERGQVWVAVDWGMAWPVWPGELTFTVHNYPSPGVMYHWSQGMQVPVEERG